MKPAASSSPSRTARRRRGVSVIELMVSMTLGLIVVAGGAVLFTGSRVMHTTSENVSRVAESLRTSNDMLGRELREAGGTPCDAGGNVSDVLNNAQGATPTWWATWGEPVHGYEGTVAFPGAAIGTATGERVTGTDAVVVRYAPALDNVVVSAHAAATAQFTTNVTNHGLAVNDLMMVCSYRQGSVFQVTAVNLTAGTFNHASGTTGPGNCAPGLGLPVLCSGAGTTLTYPAGSLLGRFVAAGWYVGNNGRTTGSSRSLYRVTSSGTQEVAEGVTDLQMSYLTNTGTDYVGAASVSDWTQVIAVRVDLTYEGSDAGVATAGASRRITRSASFTANLRNRQS